MKDRAMFVATVGICSVLAMAGMGYAQGVGNITALPSMIPLDPTGTGWNVGPVTVVRDPVGPKWVKHFSDSTGGPISAPPGSIWSVSETLIVGGNLPWADWHEEILTPGWDWTAQVSIIANNNLPPAGLSIVNTPSTPTQGGILSFYFNPLPVGTQLDIRKLLVYNGTPGQVFIGSVDVAQYPTPEPATLSLLALGGLALARGKRR